ncbi:MAG: monovalent cationH+ antiporter-2 CPA2 [Beijerinckiaceae bacterium]|nr:MAG: monovalent cationH+ antiporter-2 CPA2 [Beijerinckiaceae bacterium]
MAASINIGVYSDALVVLGTAGIVVPMVQRWGLSPVLGYLAAGALLGPLGLGALAGVVPPLHWITVSDAGNVSGIAELGIVFLLFLIGLELSFARLMTMRRLVFGFGTAQIVVSTMLIAAVARLMGVPAGPALVLGACLALSSTAIVVEVLAAQGRMTTTAGRASFAVLLAQDLAVIPLLFLISVLGAGVEGSIWRGLVLALGQAGAALAAILLFGRFLLRPLFRLVASSGSNELFIAATLFVIVVTGVVAAVAGLSMALGAFVAGLMLAETEYRKAIEALMQPFKGLLLGIFFFTIGMSIDIREVLREPLWLAAAVIALIGVKAFTTFLLGRLFLIPRYGALETALLLSPGGEFAFVGIGAALAAGVVEPGAARFALAVTAISMALIPGLGALGRVIKKRNAPPEPVDPAVLARPEAQVGHAIVVGHGRVGKVVTAMLVRHKRSFTATDSDAIAVARDRRAGHPVYYGNATDAAFLESCGLKDASAVIITIHTPEAIDAIVKLVRSLRADIPIISRARDATHARRLYAKGVTEAVPETIEASLQLSEAALVNLGVPMGKVIASIHEKRDEFRADLITAAGGETTHAIKAKTT